MFNEIDGDFNEVAIRTFKVGLSSEHGLRKSLTGKPVTSLRALQDSSNHYTWQMLANGNAWEVLPFLFPV